MPTTIVTDGERAATAGASARRGLLAIGNLIVDRTHRLPAYPEESLLAVIESSSISPGGGAINVVFDLARVDSTLPLAVAGLVGDDADGDYLRQAFAAHGIDASRVGSVADRPTSFTHVMISEARATRTFFHGHGANSRLGLDFIAALDSSARIAHLAYLLLLDGLDQPDPAYGSRGARALALLRAKGFRTSLDLVSDGDPERYRRFVAPALPHVDYLIINEVEAAGLTGFAPATGVGTRAAAFECAEQILRMGVRELVAVHYPEGAVAATRSGLRLAQAAYTVPREQVASTLGAGDAFCAGMLYGLHEDMPLDHCLRFGVALAHFNLFADSATGGAVSAQRLLDLIHAREGV